MPDFLLHSRGRGKQPVLELESIAGGSIDLEGSYLYAHSISAYDHIGLDSNEICDKSDEQAIYEYLLNEYK
jgi:hypothetical protein